MKIDWFSVVKKAGIMGFAATIYLAYYSFSRPYIRIPPELQALSIPHVASPRLDDLHPVDRYLEQKRRPDLGLDQVKNTDILSSLQGLSVEKAEDHLRNLSQTDTVLHAFLTDGKEWREVGKKKSRHEVSISISEISDYFVGAKEGAAYLIQTRPCLFSGFYTTISPPGRVDLEMDNLFRQRAKSYDITFSSRIICPLGVVEISTRPLEKNAAIFMIDDHWGTNYNPLINSLAQQSLLSNSLVPMEDRIKALNAIYAPYNAAISFRAFHP